MTYDIGYTCIPVFDLILKTNNYWTHTVLLKGEKPPHKQLKDITWRDQQDQELYLSWFSQIQDHANWTWKEKNIEKRPDSWRLPCTRRGERIVNNYMYNEIIKKKLFLDDVFIKITFSASPVLNALDEFHARIKVYFKLKFAQIN